MAIEAEMTAKPIFTPTDNAARKRIENSLDETLFVEAGAGTGKTTSLVARIVRLISSGAATLNRVAVITFTEAAAAELRDRIREELEKSISDNIKDEIERERCRRGVEDIDQASIQTLHSFALALLHEKPLEAGLPPSFDTMDEIESDLAFDENWREWLDNVLEDDAIREALYLAFSLGMTIPILRDIAVNFHENYDLLTDAAFERTPMPSPATASRVLNAADEMKRLCNYSNLADDSDKLYSHTHLKLRSIKRLNGLDTGSAQTYRLLNQMLPLKQTGGAQKNWQTDPLTNENACARLKSLLLELHELAEDEISEVRGSVLVEIVIALKDFVLDYAQKRKEQGRVGFQDMLVWARDMLRDDIGARDHFQQKYSHLLIDEAQDTDFIQAEIAMYLVEDFSSEPQPTASGSEMTDAGRPREWDSINPKIGKLFVVGDPKQSIYRFRRADVRQMRRLQERMGGDTLQLVQNFRSQRPVIEWVNHLFSSWMPKGTKEQADYIHISHRWEAATDHVAAPSVWALDAEMDGKIDAVRQEEAASIAELLHQIVGEQWQVLDSGKPVDSSGAERYRDANYADICILMPTRSSLRSLEFAFDDANVPYRLECGSMLFATQEVMDLLSCLRAIDDPSNHIAVVAALRSPAFACTDVELLQFYEAGGSFNYLAHRRDRALDNSNRCAVSRSLDVLRSIHEKRMWMATAPLIDGFIRDRMLMESAIVEPRVRERWRRYRFVVEQARAFASAGGNSLREFIDWMDRQSQEGVRIAETPVPDADEDAVRVMTMHASKGLEFPIVILTGLNSESKGGSASTKVFFDSVNHEIQIGAGNTTNKTKPFKTTGYDEQAGREDTLDDDEHVRLLYVAATRARDHLVLSLFRKKNKNPRSDAALIAKLVTRQDVWKRVELNPEYQTQAIIQGRQNGAQNQQPINYAAHTQEARAEWQHRRQEVIAVQGKPASVAATSLSHIVKDETDAELEEAQVSRRGRGGAPLGRAVHAVLQTIDIATGEGIADTARAQAAAEGIPHMQTNIEDLVRAAIESEVVRRAVKSDRYWREAHVAAPVGVGVLEGFIDLLFEEDGELIVVDYKTDAINANAAEYIANTRYRRQAGSYALITERATNKRVKDVVFLFLNPRSEHSMADIDALKADAERAAQEHLQVARS